MIVRRPKTVVVTGVAGQDGTYLARSLLADGHRVIGVTGPDGDAGSPYLRGVDAVTLDIRDVARLRRLLEEVEPDEIYNLAALSSVARSWQEPDLTHAVNTAPVLAILEAASAQRDRTGTAPRLFQASSAEVRGGAAESPYARSKAAAEDAVRRARDEHGLFAVCGILYNHESPLRTPAFVTRKITRAAAAIALGLADTVSLGNLDVVRDWGFAGEYVEAMRLMLDVEEPADLPIGTGVPHSLQDLLDAAFAAAGADPQGRVVQDPDLVRPADTARFVADPEPSRTAIGWSAKVAFEELVAHMVEVDLRRLRSGVEDDPSYLWPA